MKKETNALKKVPSSVQESKVIPSRKKTRGGLLGTIVRRFLLVLVTVIPLLFGDLLLVLNLVFNGPSPTARNQLTMTLIEASATKWVPALFIGEDAVADIRTSIVDAELKDDVTDVNTVIINRGNMISGTDEWADYPDGIRIEQVAGDTYNAHVMIVQDPAQVYLGISTQTGFSTNTPGKRITAAIEDEGAIAAINAGAFNDDGTAGSHVGSIPERLSGLMPATIAIIMEQGFAETRMCGSSRWKNWCFRRLKKSSLMNPGFRESCRRTGNCASRRMGRIKIRFVPFART